MAALVGDAAVRAAARDAAVTAAPVRAAAMKLQRFAAKCCAELSYLSASG